AGAELPPMRPWRYRARDWYPSSMRRPLLSHGTSAVPALGALALSASLALPMATASAQVPEEAKPAAQIFGDASAAMMHAKDFHISGGLHQGSQVVSLNLSMSPQGGGGSVSLRGATLQMVVTTKEIYMKADAQSWKTLAALGGGAGAGTAAFTALLANRWIKAPVTNPQLGSFANLTFSTKFLKGVVANHGTQFTKGAETTWDGRSAIPLHDGANSTSVYIAVSSPHYLLGVVATGAANSGSFKFTDFGDAPMPAIPTNALALPGF
ncbi:MAG: hypothetical protein ACYCXN_16305, partial [Acidimicrobiales bacterium]